MRHVKGLSIIEVIMAVAVIAVMFAVLTPALIDNSKRTAVTGQSAQASLLLNFFVRQVVGGNSAVLAYEATPLSWTYGELTNASFGLATENDIANPDLYQLTVINEGVVNYLGAEAVQYKTEVCFMQQGQENCIHATTLGPGPISTGIGSYLPGIN